MSESGNQTTKANAVSKETCYRLKQQPLIKDRLLAQQVRPETKTWKDQEPILDVDDIQGDALLGFNKPHLAILAIDITDDEPATITNFKRFLTDCIIPKVTTVRDVIQFRNVFRAMRERLGGVKPTCLTQVCFNVSFSNTALLKLAPGDQVGEFCLNGMQEAFTYGLKERSSSLHDPKTGIGAIENWIVCDPHILIQIGSDKTSLIDDEIETLKKGLESFGDPAKISYLEYGKRFEDQPGHEHFGFLDGISNLGLRGKYQPEHLNDLLYLTPRYLSPKDDRIDLYGLPGQLLIWPGEIILGLPKQYANTMSTDPEIVNQPGSADFIGPEWAKNGTFMVYRRLRQDVAKFWKFLRASAAEIAQEPGMEGLDDHHFGAKVIARWKSGTPILREPQADNPDLGSDRMANNSFQYQSTLEPFLIKPDHTQDGFPHSESDGNGKVCPLAAHLRKVQPRDSSTDIGNKYDTLKRIIVRRGIQYGEPIADVGVDDGVDRGLMFVCYQAIIDKQFEFIVKHWANSKFNPNGGGHDLIIGQSDADNRERTFDVPLPGNDTKVKTITTTDEWVIPTGGGYFFVPSISALKNILGKN